MSSFGHRVTNFWFSQGARFLPFADAATPELPLSRLLRLSLFQVSVGMALVLLIGTLNRVMIVEYAVPASIVGIMISLPLFFAPFRALIGFRSDTHKSVLGWKRVPFIWQGSLVQFGGLAIMPFAVLVLARQGESDALPAWIGQIAAAFSFLLVGAGLHTVQTVGLALATDLAPKESQPKVVGLMYVMLLFGMIASALLFGYLLLHPTWERLPPGQLIGVIQGSAVATLILNSIALWKQEVRKPKRLLTPEELAEETKPRPLFKELMGSLHAGRQGHPPLGGSWTWNHGVQHGGCAARTLWWPNSAPCYQRHNKIDRYLGNWRSFRLWPRIPYSEPRLRSL